MGGSTVKYGISSLIMYFVYVKSRLVYVCTCSVKQALHTGTQNRVQSYHGRNPTDISERGRVHPGGRGPRGDRSFSPPLINGDMYSDRERGPDRVRGQREHS